MKREKIRAYFHELFEAMQMELREHRSSFIVYMLLRAAVIVIALLQLYRHNYENVFFCILTLLLLVVPSLIQVTFKTEIPTTLEIIIFLFIFAAEILGEIYHFYYRFPLWDTVLHTMNGFLAAAIGLSLTNLLNKSEKIQFELSPIFSALVAFCFSMTIGVLWEFFEFGMDQLLGMNMQKDTIIHTLNSIPLDDVGTLTSIKNITQVTVNGQPLNVNGYIDIGLIDTMQDLIVNFIGAVCFSVFGYFYIKNQGDDWVAKHFVPTRKKKSQDFLKIIHNRNKKKKDSVNKPNQK